MFRREPRDPLSYKDKQSRMRLQGIASNLAWFAQPTLQPSTAACFSVVKYRSETLMADYTEAHSRAGIHAKLPVLETWPNHFPGYEITIRFPEYTSVCPKTGLPDYGVIVIQYEPRKVCLELKALKMYLLAYRNLGIFYENAVNRMLRDIVASTKPVRCLVRGEFTPRGGLFTTVEARWPPRHSPARHS